MKFSFAPLGLLLGLLAVPVSAQQSTYYLTNGDSSVMYVVQNGELQDSPTTFDLAYPVYTDGSVVRLLRRQGDEMREYNPDGTPTGVTASYPTNFDQLLDATTDGNKTYLVRCCGGTEIFEANLDFSDLQPLFDPGTGGASIAYDPVRAELLVAGFDDTVRRYTLDGTETGSFPSPTGTSLRSMAYEGTTDTFWAGVSDSIYQFDRDGNLLDTIVVPGLSMGNNFGGAMAFVASAPSEPVNVPTMSALGLGGSIVLLVLAAWRHRIFA